MASLQLSTSNLSFIRYIMLHDYYSRAGDQVRG